MDNSFQTSFIPKKPVTANIKSTRPPTSILTTFAFLVLILVGVASGGLYLYKNYLNNQKHVLSDSLQKVRNSFDRDTINELELYDKRANASQKILGNHIVLSPMFTLLGDLTLPSIQYTKFDHQSTPKGFVVKMSGTATDYKSIALQADVFNSAKGRSFKNVVFSNLTKDKSNNVNFEVEFLVDPSLLSYENNLKLGTLNPQATSDMANQANQNANPPQASQTALPGGAPSSNSSTGGLPHTTTPGIGATTRNNNSIQ